jgi:drug/metabolite transporter (DMT)-like permease
MRGTELAGAAGGALGMAAVGASLAFSTALVGYPVAPAQAARYLVGAGLLLLIARWRRIPIRRPTAAETVRLALLAATGLAGFNACVLLALGHAEPAALGVVVGAAPLVLAVAPPLSAGRLPRPGLVLAAALVVVGIGLVEGGGRTSPLGLLFAAGALAGEVAFTLLAAPLLPRLGPAGVSVHSCLLAAAMLAAGTPVVAAVRGEPVLPRPSWPEVAAAGYLAVVVTAVAFLCWYTCLARLGAERAGLLVGVMPVSALGASLAIGQTALAWPGATGVALVALGVAAGLSIGTPAPAGTTGTGETAGHPASPIAPGVEV